MSDELNARVVLIRRTVLCEGTVVIEPADVVADRITWDRAIKTAWTIKATVTPGEQLIVSCPDRHEVIVDRWEESDG